MELSTVLLFLFGMVASELLQGESRHLDFVCNSEARRVMNKVTQLGKEMVDCSIAASLPTSVQLPCIKVHKATWMKKTVLERRAEILLSLRTLAQDVHLARTQSQPGCGLALLERLERSVSNYLHVVTQLHSEQGELEGPQVLRCLGPESQDLRTVLRHFDLLLSGKLEWLITDMAQRC